MSIVTFVCDFPKLEDQVCFSVGKCVCCGVEVGVWPHSCFCSLALPTVRLMDKCLTRIFTQTICSVLIARTWILEPSDCQKREGQEKLE